MIARISVVISVLALFSLGLGLGCGDAPSKDDCQKLMDHLVEIEMAEGGSSGLSPDVAADKDAVKKRVTGYLSEDFMKSCQKSLPKSQVDCGLKAKNFAEVTACDEG